MTARSWCEPSAASSASLGERCSGVERLYARVLMLLAIDVGNTNIVLGVFDGTTLVQSWRLQTLRERTSDELGLLVDGLFEHNRIERVQIRGVILGSVVPPLTSTIREMVQRYFGVMPLVVEPGVNTLMPILYKNPA